MAERGYDEDPRIAYAQKLAEVAVRLESIPQAQRAPYADKFTELQARLEKLTPEQMAAYQARFRAMMQAAGAPDVQAGTVPGAQPTASAQGGAANAARPSDANDEDDADDENYEEEYEEDDDLTHRKKRRGGCLTICLALLVVLALLAGAGWWWVSGEINGSRGTVTQATVEIAKGSGPLTIGRQLEEAGIIRSGQVFRLWVRQQEGLAAKLQYGTFELASDMSYEELAQALQVTTDDRDTVTVTFPEGIPAVEFANRLEAAGLCTAQEFLDAANNGDFSSLGFWDKRDENPDQFMACEGYLFPDTYQFFVGDDVNNIVYKLYAEFDSKMTEEMYQKIDDMGMTLSEFMTLASLVQEEAGSVEHQADVAAIFMNRLADDSPVTLLQSNCSSYIQNENDNNYLYNTVAWYYGDWSLIPSEIIAAYDTYSTPGLPAGPISNPGMDAIENTLRYAESPYYDEGYYFFVTDTDGNYYFNKTAAAHEAKCAELRAAGKMAG